MIEPVARLRIELQEIEPRLWRRVDAPLSSTLPALHDIIQSAFGWSESHRFEFAIGERVFRLKTLVERFLYVYDFGDDRRHDIFIASAHCLA